MHAANRIIVVEAQDTGGAADWANKLADRGCAVRRLAAAAVAEAAGEGEQADLVLIGADNGSEATIDIARALKASADTAHLPVAADELLARLTPLFRLSTMFSEMRRRAATARAFGVHASAETFSVIQEAGANVLLVGGSAETMDAIAAAAAEGVNLLHVSDPFKAADTLNQNRYDAVIVDLQGENQDGDGLYLCSHIRNNPGLFNLPVLLLASSDTFGDPSEPYLKGASKVVYYANGGFDAEELGLAIGNLVRRQRRRWQVRNALESTHRFGAVDDLTRLYNRDFLVSHLNRLIACAARTQKPLSVILISVQNLSGIAREFGEAGSNQLMQQVASWVKRLIRSEDMAGRHDRRGIVVALPDADAGEARIVGQRIAGVLLNTEFTLRHAATDNEAGDPVRAWVETGAAETGANDSIGRLIDRARRDLR